MANPIIRKRKKTARAIRTSSQKNSDGTTSTHKMEYGSTDSKGRGKYVVNPTVFPNKDGSWSDLSNKGNTAYNEAKRRGEVFGFRREKVAKKFAAGSWKSGSDRKEAMKNYRKNKSL